MIKKEISKEEIENNLRGKGDYVQIDYLTRLIAGGPHILIKNHAYSKLVKLYESKKMFGDAGKMYENLGINSIQQSDKVSNFVKAAESFVKDGSFERADSALKKAMSEAKESERAMIYVKLKEFYKQQAEAFEKEMKRAQAAKIYEKILLMRIMDSEKEVIKKKLIDLYEKLGKFKESSFLKNRKY